MRPDWEVAIVGLTMIAALLAVGMMLGVAAAQWAPAPACPSCVCERTTTVEAATCLVERCERVVEVKVFKDALQCRPTESVCKTGDMATCCDLRPIGGEER